MVVFSSFKTAELKYEHHGVVIGAGFGDQCMGASNRMSVFDTNNEHSVVEDHN